MATFDDTINEVLHNTLFGFMEGTDDGIRDNIKRKFNKRYDIDVEPFVLGSKDGKWLMIGIEYEHRIFYSMPRRIRE